MVYELKIVLQASNSIDLGMMLSNLENYGLLVRKTSELLSKGKK